MATRKINPRCVKPKKTKARARRCLPGDSISRRAVGRKNLNPGKLVDPREIPPHKKDN